MSETIVKNRIWGLEYQEVFDGNKLFWLTEIKNPFMEADGRYRIGLNAKFLYMARQKGVEKFIIKVGEREIMLNNPSEKELKRKTKEKEFELKPSIFAGSMPMKLYHFKI